MLSSSGIQTNGFNAVFNGPIAGGSGLTEYGGGALVLNANSPYTGTLTDQAGALIINAIVPATIAAQGSSVVLGGDGRVGDATLQGILAPGADASSAGVFSASSMTLYSSLFDFDLGPNGDQVDIDNALTKNTGSGSSFEFVFNDLAGLQPGNTYDLFNFGSTTFVASDFTYYDPSGLTGYFTVTPNSILFTVNPVPEPTSLAAGALLGFGILSRRRRQPIENPKSDL